MAGRPIQISFLIILILFPAIGLTQEKMVVRFESPAPDMIAQALSTEADIAGFKPGEYLDMVITGQQYDALIDQGKKIRIMQTEAGHKANLQSTGYRDYNTLIAELQSLVQTYPQLCRVVDIGDSYAKIYSNQGNTHYDAMKHDIWVVKISDNVDMTEDEPAVYFLGGHHAREPIGVEVTMTILNYLLEQYAVNDTVKNYLDNTEIWFIPLVNPDGHQVVLSEMDVWWRKNIRDNNHNNRYDRHLISRDGNGVDGVDLNRNYDFEWGVSGSSAIPRSSIYRGSSGNSEPEVQAVLSLMAYRKFVAGISYHSYGELVMFPYGYAADAYAPDWQAMGALAEDMAKAIPGISGGNYLAQPAWKLYPCSGTTDDYAYGMYGTFLYTIELATEFIPAAEQVWQICQDNIQGATVMLDRLNRSLATGHVVDAATGLPIVAEVFVTGIDDSPIYRAPITSEPLFGRYYRLLLPGTYQMTFSKPGYTTVTFNTVSVNATGQTVLEVRLAPIVEKADGVTTNRGKHSGSAAVGRSDGLAVSQYARLKSQYG